MESSFNLTAARSVWLANLKCRETISAEALRELETHLDDAVEDLTSRGLAADEAFIIGTRRLGCAERLAEEYSKATFGAAWKHRAKWMLMGVVIYLASLAVSEIISQIAYVAAHYLPEGMNRAAVAPATYMAASILGLWMFHRILRGKLQWRPAWTRRSPALGACGVLTLAVVMPMAARTASQFFIISTRGPAAFAESMGFVKDFWAVPVYGEMMQSGQAELHKFIVEGVGTAQGTLDTIATKHEDILKKGGLLK